MSLNTGDRLGSYEVIALLGAGGMGEVYRAHDTNLGRDIALKVLPTAFALDPERLARFKREAQVLAALNHPHIASIYGLEESPGGFALVLELVDGPTLADRLVHGPLPLDEAWPIARQVSEALEAAHDHGHHSPRSEAGQHQGTRGRHGEGARLRSRQSLFPHRHRRRRLAVANTDQSCRHAHRAHHGHGRLHEPRAGARQDGRQTRGRVGVRLRVVRNAGRHPSLCRRRCVTNDGAGHRA